MATNNDINLKITVDANQAQQSTTNYKAKIKELKEQMAELLVETNGLADATAEQRAQYESLAKEAGSLTDALGDVSARIRANADDYQAFGAVLEGLGAATSVVQGLAGQISLLGGESVTTEQLAKSFMALQGQLNAINNVQKVFNKDSKLMISLQNTLNTAIKEGGDSAKVATVAQKGLNAAMKAAPYIAIASALITVVAAITDFVRQTNAAKDAQDEFGNSIRTSNEELAKQNILMKADADDVTTTMETLIKMAKEAGGNVTKLNSIFASFSERTGFTVKSVKEMEWAFRLQNNVIEKNNKTIESAANANSAYREQLGELAKQEVRLKNDLSQLTEGSESYNLTLSELQKTQGDMLTLQTAIRNNTKASVEAEQKNKNTIAEFNAESEKRNKTEEKTVTTVKRRNALTEEQIKLLKILDLREGTNYAQKIKYEDQIKSSLQEKMVKLADELEHQKVYAQELAKIADEKKAIDNDELDTIGKINAKYDERIEEVKKLGLTEQQVAQLELLINKNREKELEKETDKDRAKKLANQYEIEAKEQEVARIKGRVAGLQEGTPEYFDALIGQAEAQRDLELEQLEQDKEAKLISEEDYQKRKKEIIDKYNTDNYESAKTQAEKELEAKQLLVDTLKSIYSSLYGFIDELQTAELKNAEGNEKKQAQIKKKYAIIAGTMKIAQIIIDTVEGAMQAYNVGMSAGFPAGLVLGPVLAAATAAFGAVQVATASAQMANNIKGAKAARGAYVVGASHTAGGVNMELEGGEIVLNKNVARIPQYRAIASAMNVSTGGIPLGGGGLENGAGFGVTKEDVQTIVQQTVAGIAAIPVVVSAQTISERQRQVNVTEQRSQI